MTTLFESLAPQIMRDMMKDFGLDASRAAAILGNLGHESAGFKSLQEITPIGGGRGGYGWAQWTGPRRVLYEAYCKRNNLDPKSYKANYGFLFVELTGSEKAAIPALKNAPDLNRQVIAFEANFERAGVKNYPSREAWAQKALAAYRASPQPKAPDAPIANDPPAGEVIGPAVIVLPKPVEVPAAVAKAPDDPGVHPDEAENLHPAPVIIAVVIVVGMIGFAFLKMFGVL